MNKTILYYTSNHEDPEFEQKIIDDMLTKAGDIPIISVSQKPMNLGQNICVGDVGQSYVNEWRQILIGAKAAVTEYVITAESDFCYPPEYFNYEPKGRDIYRYDNIWIMWLDKKFKKFHRKKYSEGAQIVKRKFFIYLLEKYLLKYPNWQIEHYKKSGSDYAPYYDATYTFFHGENPSVSIKTRNGCSWHVGGYEGGIENIATDLPYWGNIEKLKNKFL